jgi:hypothetical protein
VASVLAVMAVVGTTAWWSTMIWRPPRNARPTLVATSQTPREVAQAPQPSPGIDARDLLDPVWQARDEAACTMVFMAQRHEARLGKEETKNQYERVIALFPESHWAQVARQETQRLEKQN